MQPLDALYRKINYEFKNKDLLEAALTHRSIRGSNNERLEFLGDALLNFVIAEALYLLFDKAKEGELSRLRAMLVKGETLAVLAQELQLGDYLRLGPGELRSGGFSRKSILADAFEAIIGAIYLDSGFEVCRQKVLQWFEFLLKEIDVSSQKDPKTKLQEYLQARKMPLPQYKIERIEGEAHSQLFYISCRVPGLEFVTESSSTNRRHAEQLAAAKYLEMLNIK